MRHPWGFYPEARRGSQGASRAAPGKSGLHARGEGVEKAEEPEIKLPTCAGSWKKQESSRKTSISALLTMPKALF